MGGSGIDILLPAWAGRSLVQSNRAGLGGGPCRVMIRYQIKMRGGRRGPGKGAAKRGALLFGILEARRSFVLALLPFLTACRVALGLLANCVSVVPMELLC